MPWAPNTAPASAESTAALGQPVHVRRGEGGAHGRMRRIDFDHRTRFGILQPSGPDVGEYPFRGILEGHGDDIVSLRESRQRLLEIIGEKV